MDDHLPAASLRSLLTTLDQVLRGAFLQQKTLAEGRVEAPVRRLLGLGLVLGGFYGVCLGGYALFGGAAHAWMQIAASAVKVPLLFLLTLLVTFPSLYVFAALQRLPLDFAGTLRLLLLSIVVHVTVLASLGPVFAFFAASTNSYSFLVLLNVAFFAIGGLLGLMVLRRATRTMFQQAAVVADGKPAGEGERTAVRASGPASAGQQARRLLAIWCVVYGVVGAQMGWLLRPFLGAPDRPFQLFRAREDNFLVAVLRTIGDMFGR